MELFTTIALTVGLFVLLATWVTAVLMIKTDVFAAPNKQASAAPVSSSSYDNAPRELVNSR
ncbi:MAG TPA: hypothetical protein VF635_14495 [Propionibacteriaceae bacterium]